MNWEGDAFSHRVRVSKRAKYVSLRMSVQRGLEVVVPPSYDLRRIPSLLETKRRWIETVRQRFETIPPIEPAQIRPVEIYFPAVSKKWSVTYSPTARRGIQLQEIGDQLFLTGNIQSDLACRRALRRWLLGKAKSTLTPWLRQTSAELDIPFSKAAVRLQRSRWGSCSRRQTISLNGKLLFLAPELVRYLFIHELCHIAQMNHSPKF